MKKLSNKKQKEIIALKNISSSYHNMPILKNISLKVEKGNIVGIMGPNGAGKSSILKTIFGLMDITEGVMYLNKKIINPKPKLLIKNKISYAPQENNLFNNMTVLENLEMGGIYKNQKELKELIENILIDFPALKNILYKKAKFLSGGQQRMLILARALVSEPELILLDEPFIGLSQKAIKDIISLIKKINTKYNLSFLIVEHNIKLLGNLLDKVYLISNGKILIEERCPEKILSEEYLIRFFKKLYNQ
jgi:branched-chain amino acid transport system ATP-binding protein